MKQNSMNKLEKSWVLYDVANSAFTMITVSLIPIWFKDLAINGKSAMSMDQATGSWAMAVAIATLISAIMGPILGSMTDNKGWKKPIFTTSLAIGAIGCILTGFSENAMVFLIIAMVARLAYSASLVFYDSMLTDVTTPERSDMVSSHGYAWGYIGSCLPFLIALIAYAADYMWHIIDSRTARIIGCSVTAIWWFAVSLPLLKNYKQIYYEEDGGDTVKGSLTRLWDTLKHIAKKDKKVFLFLVSFFLYIDGVGTIINNAINIGTDLGLDVIGQVVFLLGTQVVAFAFSLLFSRLSKTVETVKLLYICIFGYLAVCLYAFTLTRLWQFGIMAFGVGMFQGAIQALSRSYYSRIIPAESSGQYFGLYDIFAKGASFFGSLLIAIIKYAGGSINLAVAALSLFFLLGYIFLKKADRTPGREQRGESF